MRRVAWLCAGLCAGLCASSTRAALIWAVDGPGLINFDSAAPQNITRVGVAGVGLMRGLDFAANGTLYGFGNAGLYSFNTTTGVATLIGNPDLQDEQVLDMSWNPADNRMEIVTALASDEPHHLRSVNLANGSVTTIGTLNISQSAAVYGYAVNAAGTRYLHDADGARMIQLNGALVGANMPSPTGNGLGSPFEGMTINWSNGGAWYHAGLSGDSGRQELWSINPASGAGTFLGNIGTIDYEFNFGDIAIAPVPEPGSLVLLGLGALVLRRSRR